MTKPINNDALSLIKRWEGCKLTAYRDIVGVWTIGYGHTSRAGPPTVKAGLVITQDEAGEILKKDLIVFMDVVDNVVKVPVNENMRGAMVSLCYNIGPGAFSESSLVRKLNAGDVSGAADAFLSWKKAGGRDVQGLLNRRHDERKLFLKPDNGATIAAPVVADVTERKPLFLLILEIITAIFKRK